jgi:hypothetical protein
VCVVMMSIKRYCRMLETWLLDLWIIFLISVLCGVVVYVPLLLYASGFVSVYLPWIFGFQPAVEPINVLKHGWPGLFFSYKRNIHAKITNYHTFF